MYVWMVLAVFMAAIFSFNIAPRDDMHQVTQIPAAEGVAAKMMTLHNSSMVMLSKDPSYSGGAVGYNAHTITSLELNNYLPIGYCFNAGCATDIQTQFTAKIVCLDDTNFTTAVACNAGNAANFLVTWGDVPRKWMLLQNGKPQEILIQAMGSVSDNDENFGYTTDYTRSNSFGSNIGIMSAVGNKRTVPLGVGVPKGKLIYLTRLR